MGGEIADPEKKKLNFSAKYHDVIYGRHAASGHWIAEMRSDSERVLATETSSLCIFYPQSTAAFR